MTEKAKHVYRKSVPYTTKTGVQIGIAYQPPLQQITQEGEIIQSVLLGKRSIHFVSNGMMWYATGVICVFIILAAVVGK